MVEEKPYIAQALSTISLIIFKGSVKLFVWKIVSFISIRGGYFYYKL